MMVKIVDTTLRDGEQKPGIALGIPEKTRIAALLDRLGVFQIEAGIPAMGGSEKESIRKIMALGLKSKIAVWNRMNLSDIKHSVDCAPDIIHISVPCSELQVIKKLNKDHAWLLKNLEECISFAQKSGCLVTVGLEDASRADFTFLLRVIKLAGQEGVQRVRYADTVGILHPQRIYDEIKKIKDEIPAMEVEIHAHNDLGMAVANSIAAVEAGAGFVDCTMGGIGERAGNCDFGQFIHSARSCLGLDADLQGEKIWSAQADIARIISGKEAYWERG